MSSRPGLKLEDYLMWEYDIIVVGLDDANESLKMAELLGHPSRRVTLSKEQFDPIVAMAEPHRDDVEWHLSSFREDEQSWRDYAGYVEWLPKEISDKIYSLISAHKDQAKNSTEKHWSEELPAGAIFGVFGSN